MFQFQGDGVIQLTPLMHTQYTSPCNCGYKVLDYAAAASEARHQSQRPPLIPCESVKESARIPWSHEEHKLFLVGLEKYGKGHWKDIASYMKSKTSVQVASHAQKYFNRQTAPKKRRSIHDIAITESNSGQVPRLSDHPNSVQHLQNNSYVDMPMMEFNKVEAPQFNDHYNNQVNDLPKKWIIEEESNDLLDDLLLAHLNHLHNMEPPN